MAIRRKRKWSWEQEVDYQFGSSATKKLCDWTRGLRPWSMIKGLWKKKETMVESIQLNLEEAWSNSQDLFALFKTPYESVATETYTNLKVKMEQFWTVNSQILIALLKTLYESITTETYTNIKEQMKQFWTVNSQDLFGLFKIPYESEATETYTNLKIQMEQFWSVATETYPTSLKVQMEQFWIKMTEAYTSLRVQLKKFWSVVTEKCGSLKVQMARFWCNVVSVAIIMWQTLKININKTCSILKGLFYLFLIIVDKIMTELEETLLEELPIWLESVLGLLTQTVEQNNEFVELSREIFQSMLEIGCQYLGAFDMILTEVENCLFSDSTVRDNAHTPTVRNTIRELLANYGFVYQENTSQRENESQSFSYESVSQTFKFEGDTRIPFAELTSGARVCSINAVFKAATIAFGRHIIQMVESQSN